MHISKILQICVLVVLLSTSFALAKQHDLYPYFTDFHEYQVDPLKRINVSADKQIEMQLAFVEYNDQGYMPMQRIQFMNKHGRIVAFTPTRYSIIPLCYSLDYCFVFMWKTVYPLPALFQLNSDQNSWINEKVVPMRYSRKGYAGEGFTEVTNPIYGFFGVSLFFFQNISYFCVIIFLSILLCLQIMKYHDMDNKHVVKKLLKTMALLKPTWLPIEPFIITCGLIYMAQAFGSLLVGIPSVLTFFTIIISFLLCAVRIGKKRKESNPHP